MMRIRNFVPIVLAAVLACGIAQAHAQEPASVVLKVAPGGLGSPDSNGKVTLTLASGDKVTLSLSDLDITASRAVSAGAERAAGAVRMVKPRPRMSESVVSQLLAVAKTKRGNWIGGIFRYSGKTNLLGMFSYREMVVSKSIEAAQRGARYTPPEETVGSDIVMISCGDPDLRERFDCASLHVLGADGQRIEPLDYESGRRQFSNALGSKWTAVKTEARYAAPELKSGFTVIYAGTDGIEYTVQVSAKQAADQLFLSLE